MAAQVKSFPKYQAPRRTLITSDAKTVLKEWKTYLEQIKYTTSQTPELITQILINLENMIDFYNIHFFSISDNYINFFDSSLENLYSQYTSKDLDSFTNNLNCILKNLGKLKNTIYLNNISSINAKIQSDITAANENLTASINILELSNLKGLSGEFELQYNQYNSERKFWGVLIVIFVISILFRTVNITIHPITDITVLTIYIIGFLLFLLWISPNSFNRLTNLFLRNKSFLNTNALHRRITIIQIALILGLIELTLISYFALHNISFAGINLKLFSVSTYKITYNNLNEWLPTLSLYIPLVWALWFSVKQYHYTIKLMNAYRFKMALSLAYNGYKKECDELGNTDHKEHLMHEVLTVVADDPTKRDFKDTHMPWAEIKEIFNIASKSK